MGVSPEELKRALEDLLALQQEFEDEELSGSEDDVGSLCSTSPPMSPGFEDRNIATCHDPDESEILDLDEFMASNAEGEEGVGAMREEKTFWSFLEEGEKAKAIHRQNLRLAEGGETDSVWSGFGTWEELERSCKELDTSGEGIIESMDLTALMQQQDGNTPGHCSSPGMVKISRGLLAARGLAQLSLADSPGAASAPGLLGFRRKNGLAAHKSALTDSPLNPASPAPLFNSPVHHNSPAICGSPAREGYWGKGMPPFGYSGCASPLHMGPSRHSSTAGWRNDSSGCASPGQGRLSRGGTQIGRDSSLHAGIGGRA